MPAKKEIWVYKDQHHHHGFYRYCCSSYHVRKLFNVCYIIIETFLISFHTFPPYQNTNYTHHHQHFLYSNEKLLWIVAIDFGVNTILNECVQICCYKWRWIKSFFRFFSSLLFLSLYALLVLQETSWLILLLQPFMLMWKNTMSNKLY